MKVDFICNTDNFIVLEGLDGCGKTTIISKLKEDFPKFFYTKEPGGTPFMHQIRNTAINSDFKDAFAMTSVMAISRLHNLIDNFDKFYNEKVICDRWVMSNLVYQKAFDSSELNNGSLFTKDARTVACELQHAIDNIIGRQVNPKYIVICINPETSIERQKDKDDKDKMDDILLEDKRRILETYKTLIDEGTFGKVRRYHKAHTTPLDIEMAGVVMVDGERPLEDVYQDIADIIKISFKED